MPRIFRHQISRGSVTIVTICVFLAAITWLVFGQTLRHDFVNYDDQEYVYNNLQVTSGLTLHGVTWAFTHSHSNNWHPLTWLTHMLDWQLYERNAGGHHFTNVLLHTVGTLLLFLVLAQMTGALWRSAFVAAVFAVHPLHVESVAWIAERKDVLSGVFFMLTLGAYVRYVHRQTLGQYAVIWILFACGLMSKPMLVTLPFVLLLLDYWPLNRVRNQRSEVGRQKSGVSSQPPSRSYGEPRWSVVRGLIVEKVPLLALSVVSCVATLLAQWDAISSISRLPFWWRLNNAFLSYVVYVRQMFWPFGLAPFYPYPQTLPGWEVAVSILLLIGITAAAIALRRKHPYLVTGWFWYLGMLVPVIGVVQVGPQAHADRYTYLPQIGIYLALTWMIGDLAKAWRRQWILGSAAAAVIAFLSWSAWIQASYWRESESLWKHTLAVTTNNEVAHNQLGNLFLEKRLTDEAAAHYQALAWALATASDASLRNGSQALELATQANQLSGGRNPIILRTLAAAYAENRQFSQAVQSAKSALELATTQRNQALAQALQNDISLYQIGLPYRKP